MSDLEQTKDGYFNYLANEILDAILNATDYTCTDYKIVQLDMLLNLKELLKSRKDFEDSIKILSLFKKEN